MTTEPTQSDRDAALAWKESQWAELQVLMKDNPYNLIQAFAAHREASTAALSKRVEVLEAALRWYADQMCEGLCQGKDPRACAAIGADNCAGCPAVVALNKAALGGDHA